MSQMRSYEAARTLYSFLGFLAWCVIIIGVIVAFAGGAAVSSLGSMGMRSNGAFPGFVLGLGPGLFVSFVGFLALAVVQNGRAAVDTAEYTQQMLQIARDQLDVSRQTLKQKSGAPASGFAEFVERQQPAPADATDGANTSFAHRPADAGSAGSVETSRYMGQTIEYRDGKFIWNGTVFNSLQDAKFHLDRQASLASSQSSETPITRPKLGDTERDA